jgi:hypothetical protein
MINFLRAGHAARLFSWKINVKSKERAKAKINKQKVKGQYILILILNE